MAIEKFAEDLGWTEPESEHNIDTQSEYPYNHVIKTESGHFFEMDDTKDRERVRLHHRSKTFLEMHPNGDEVHKIQGDGYEIIAGRKNVLVKGVCNITIEGDAILNVKGNKIERVEKDYKLEVYGNYDEVVYGNKTMSTNKNLNIAAGAGSSFLDGAVTIRTPNYVQIDADVGIDGELTANKIASETRVDAGTGMRAGPLGFVTLYGGVAAGLPFALPAHVAAAVGVAAPFGTFVLMADTINVLLHNLHIHGVIKHSYTTFPFPPMLGSSPITSVAGFAGALGLASSLNGAIAGVAGFAESATAAGSGAIFGAGESFANLTTKL